ncbi:MAG: Ig-like domain-containing protein, partial [Desulfobacterales bacterium]|nr:Ig-like domain-containing protein [Desulfobacterales bacterium]
MRKAKVFIGILILLLVVMACDIGGLSIDLGLGGDFSSSTGGQIETGVDSPANGAALPMGPVDIAYHATCTDGIMAIELSVNGEVLSTIPSPDSSQQVVALKYTWQPNTGGSHTIRVRAQNSLGEWSDYSASTVNIEGNQQAPQQENPPSEPEPEKEAAPPAPTETPEFMTIYNIEHNLDKFYYGGGSCGSREITISADITHPDD